METEKIELSKQQIEMHLLEMRSELASFNRGLQLLENQAEIDKTDKAILGPMIDFAKNYINVKTILIEKGNEFLKEYEKIN